MVKVIKWTSQPGFPNVRKKIFLAQKWGWMIVSFQNKFSCICSGLKYKFCVHWNMCPDGFALALVPRNKNNVLNHFLTSRELKTDDSVKTQHYEYASSVDSRL